MRIWAAIAIFLVGLFPTLAAAQVNLQNLGANTVVGRSAIGPGPAQAIPFAALVAAMLNSGITTPTVNTNSVVFKGSVSGQATLSAQAAAGSPTILIPTNSGTFADTASSPLALDAGTGNLTCPNCVVGAGTAASSVVGNVPQLSNTTDTGITDSGISTAALPQAVGLQQSVTPTTATVTITGPATPAVIGETGHVHKANDPITLTNSGGALPAGFTAGVTYFVVGSSILTNSYELATSVANAKAGIAVNTSGAGTGTQTASAWASIPAGYRGHIDATTVAASPGVNIPFQTVTQVATLSEGPGIFDCSGESWATAGSTTITREYHTVITTVAPPTLTSLPNIGNGAGEHVLGTVAGSNGFSFSPGRYVFTASTPLYLATYLTFGTDTNGSNGSGSAVGWGYMRCMTW